MRRGAPPAAPDPLGGLRLAPLTRRCACLGYEGLVLSAIVLVTGFLTAPLVAPVDGARPVLHIPTLGARVVSACSLFGATGAYFVWSWTGGRRTLPMKTWRLSLARADGRPVDARTAVTRYFAAWIGPAAALAAYVALDSAGLGAHAGWLVALNFLWASIDPERQFLHDRIAGTRILIADDPPGRAPGRHPR